MGADVLVTGIGVVAPNGGGTERFWAATLAGRSGLGPLTRFDPAGYPVQVAGEVTDLDPDQELPRRLLPQTDRATRLALVAADRALADGAVVPAELPDYAVGVVIASASGGFEFGQRELQNLWRHGPVHVSAYQSFAWFYAVNTGQISIRHGIRGTGGVLVGEQAGGLDAVAHARRQLARGTSVVVTGGVDASLCPWGVVAQIPSGRLSPRTDPARAYLPFDVDACGHAPGEGGAILLLEAPRSAAARGARSYGRIAGYGATFDPRPGCGREPGLRRAAVLALADAGVPAAEVDLVLADAAGVPELDRVEAAAITALFGPYGVPVTAPKTMTGRLYSGGAALDLATALLALRDQVMPPTVNVTRPADGCADLDLVLDGARPARLRTVLVLARGYGGFNAAVVVRADGTTE